jgi:hypothetical protein
MSAPQTDIEKQERRHKPALIGLRVIIGFAVLALVWFVASQVGEDPAIAADGARGEASAAVD